MITRRQFLKNIAKGLTALALPVAAVSADYLDWVKREARGK